MASQAQVLANTENAQLSTGPKSESGKSISKLNAYRHGLTAATAVFSPEEAEAFATFSAGMLLDLQPVGAYEQQHAADLIITHWRLNRVPSLEANLIMLSQVEPAPCHLAQLEDSPLKSALLEGHALIAYERQLRNLHLQEQRLHRHLRVVTNQLAALQNGRENEAAEAAESSKAAEAAQAAAVAKDAEAEPLPHPIGFDFTDPDLATPELAYHRLQARMRTIKQTNPQHYCNNPPTGNVQSAL